MEAYHDIGVAKYQLHDYPGSLAAFTQAIELNTLYAKSFFCRGYMKLQLGDRYSGCIDLKQAGKLGYKQAYEVLRDIEDGGEFEMLPV